MQQELSRTKRKEEGMEGIWILIKRCRRRRQNLPFKAVSRLQGEGSGTPLQYSCLENPMDGGTW